MAISPLPPAPVIGDQNTFSTAAATFLGAMPALATEMNAEIERINTIANGSFSATSVTSLTIGTGVKTITIDTGKAFAIGQPVMIASTASASNFMTGQVTAYNSATGAMTVNVTQINGSGTFAVWTVSLSALAQPTPVQNYYKNKTVYTSTTTFTVPSGVSSIRAYAVGKGGNGGASCTSSTLNANNYAICQGGSGGGLAYGDIAVNAGDVISLNIVAGVATVVKGGVTLLTGNAGVDGSNFTSTANATTSFTTKAGGTGVKDDSVTNGGTCQGGSCGNSYSTGGGAGLPTGTPINTGGALNLSGARQFHQRYTDPLLSDANGGIGLVYRTANPAYAALDAAGYIQTGQAGNGGKTPDINTSVSQSVQPAYYTGINGGDFSSGSVMNISDEPSSTTHTSLTVTAGAGGFMAAGGNTYAFLNSQYGGYSGMYSYGGNGGIGAGGGGAYAGSAPASTSSIATARGGTGGAAAIILMY